MNTHRFISRVLLLVLAVLSTQQGIGFSLAENSTNGQGNSSSSQSSTGNNEYKFSEDQSINLEIKNRVMESNPDVGTMTMQEVRTLVKNEAKESISEQLESLKTEYEPKNGDSKTRSDTVISSCEEIVILSAMIADEELGQQLENSAKTYLLGEDKVNKAIDEAETRSSFAKFFIGANYSELKTVKTQIEQNRLRIMEMNRVMARIENQSDQAELKVAISTLEGQNTALQGQLDESEKVFSLFGWFIKWVNGY